MARLGRGQPFKPLIRPFVLVPVGGNVTLGITGVESATAVGSVGVVSSVGPTGVASVSAVGNVGVQHTNALTGVTSAGLVGNVNIPGNVTLGLSGVSSQCQVGDLSPSVSIRLVGVTSVTILGAMVAQAVSVLSDTLETGPRRRLRWYTCQRCGKNYPETSIIVQRGLIVCNGPNTCQCYDQPGYQAERRRLKLPIERRPTTPPIDSGDL